MDVEPAANLKLVIYFPDRKSMTITGAPISVTSSIGNKSLSVVVDSRPHIQTVYKKIAPSLAEGPISTTEKVGTCSSVILNPGCREECLTDYDCI
ncbi:unnamed protein product, partial [Strongylus vulgaris]